MANNGSSILAADFGSVNTRVMLFDLVQGRYRLIAQESGLTTLNDPADDVSVGLRQLLRRIEQYTGRTLVNSDGQVIMPEDMDHNGVDAFITTSSAGRPMRAVLVSLIPEVSLSTALRTIDSAYVEPVAEVHLRDGRTEEERLNALLRNRPNLIFISGGVEHGAQQAVQQMLQLVHLALRITPQGQRPLVIYAGNSALSAKVHGLLGDLTAVYVADNIRPDISDEEFDSAEVALGRVFDQYRDSADEGFHAVSEMSSTGILPTAQSYELLAEYLRKAHSGNVIVADVGSTSCILVGSFGDDVATRISTRSGVGHSAPLLLEQVGTEAIARWLPFIPAPAEIENYALNKSIRPASVPMNVRELYLETAFLREALRYEVQESLYQWRGTTPGAPLPPVAALVIGGSPLAGTGNPFLSMMLAADALQPTGVTRVYADPSGFAPMFAPVGRLNPEAAVQLAEGGALVNLGTLISIEGYAAPDRTVARLTITTGDGEKINYELKGGHLLSLPLPAEYSLTLQIRTVGAHRIGGKRRLKLTLSGGAGGILLDARGRNFEPAAAVAARAQWMPLWLHEATDEPLQPIPPEWLGVDASQVEAVPAAQPADILELAGFDEADFPENGDSQRKKDDELNEELGSLRDLL